MNVLHIDEQRGWRGGELQASWLIRALLERGDRVVLAGRPNCPFLKMDYGKGDLHRVEAPFLTEIDPVTILRLARAVKHYKIDLLHAQTSHAHLTACLVRRVAGRGKVIVHRRVSFAPRPHPFNRWKYSMPDTYVAVSRKVADVLVEYGIPESKVRLVHSAVDLARMDVAPISRAELGVPEGVPLLGSAGALVGHKDHATLLDAMPTVLQRFPQARLLIAGEGELRSALTAQIARLRLGDAVTLLGRREDAPRIIKTLDVYISSSWSEGLGTSVLEALAAEVPVVATDAGGVFEMVIDGRTGRFVPQRDPAALAEAIVQSLEDRPKSLEMARNGRAHVLEHFTVQRMVEGNLRVYDELTRPAD